MAINKKTLQTAAAAKSVTGGKGLLVFATANRGLLKKSDVSSIIARQEHTAFQCGDCASLIVSSTVTNPHPFCTICGSHRVKAKAAITPRVPKDSDLVAIACPSCNVSNVLASSVVKATGHNVHCASCGCSVTASGEAKTDLTKLNKVGFGNSTLNAPSKTSVLPKVREVSAELLEEDLEPNVSAENYGKLDDDFFSEGEEADFNSGESFGVCADEQELEALDTNGEELELSDLNGPHEHEMSDFDHDDLDAQLGIGKESSDFETLDNTVGDGEAYAPPQSTASDESEDEYEGEEADALEDDEDENEDENEDDIPEVSNGEDLVDTVGLDDTETALTFASVGNKLVALKGHYAIATLTKKAAGKNADIMLTSSFKEASKIQAKRLGLRKGLVSLGFSLVKTPAVSKATVNAAVAREAQKAANDRAAFNKVWSESLALATVGLNRNLWKNKQNPLRAALETELRNFGVRSPKTVTAHLFADNGIAYSKTLIEVANKIASMSPNARREYADMLDMTDDEVEADSHTDEMPDNDYESDEAEELLSDVQSRLVVPARSVESAAFVRSNTNSPKALSTANAILSGEAKLKFSSL